MRKRTIPYREASVAATFYEPVYQRLRLWNNGRFVSLLCFVHESPPALRSLLDARGAIPSRSFRAKCFAEMWELPSTHPGERACTTEECDLDRLIAEALGCLGGKYSAAAGTLCWGDIHERSARRQLVSRLLQESQAKRGPFR